MHSFHRDADALRERALEHMLDRGGPFLWTLDEAARPVWVSPSWYHFSGRTPGEDFSIGWNAAVHPDDREGTLAFARAEVRARHRFEVEYRLRRADGEMRWVLAEGLPFTDGAGAFAGYVGATQDIHERRTLADALKLAGDQQKAIFDQMGVVVFTADGEGRYRFVNQAWKRQFNPRREEVVGRRISEFFPADIEHAMMLENAEVLAHPGLEYQAERTLPAASGPRPFLTTKLMILDTDGITPLVCGVGTDLTRVREAEAERASLAARLEQAQKIESLGLMAGGVAHDFNNLLTGVLGNVEMALEDLPPDAMAAATLRQAQSATQRAAALARQMLAYTGHTHLTRIEVDPGALVTRVRERFAREFGKHVTLALELDPRAPIVLADSAQLEQALANVIGNAGEAIGERSGKVTLRVRAEHVDPAHPCDCVAGASCPDGLYACIEVEDDGAGMDVPALRRVFDPFYTTKQTRRGLGLSTALGIVRAHGGGVSLDSAPGRGTRLRIFLPASVPVAAADAPRATARTRVLVVDDESTVRELACVALERAGYSAIAAIDGVEALTAWEEHGGKIAVVLADVAMPRMGGIELLAELRRRGHDVPLVLMSGGEAPRSPAAGGVVPAGYLEKPCRVSDIVRSVRRLAPPTR